MKEYTKKDHTLKAACEALDLLKEEGFVPFSDVSKLPEWFRICVFENAAVSYMTLYGYKKRPWEDDRNEVEDHTFNYEVLSEVLKNVLSSEGYKGFEAQCELEVLHIYKTDFIH